MNDLYEQTMKNCSHGLIIKETNKCASCGLIISDQDFLARQHNQNKNKLWFLYSI